MVSVNADYKSPSTFEDRISIEISVTKYTGGQVEFSYKIKNQTTGKLCAVCSSRHCFVKDGKLCSLSRLGSRFDSILVEQLAKE